MENQQLSETLNLNLNLNLEEEVPLPPKGAMDDPFFEKCKLALNGATEHLIETVRQGLGIGGSKAESARVVASMLDTYGPGPLIAALEWFENPARKGHVRNVVSFLQTTAATKLANANAKAQIGQKPKTVEDSFHDRQWKAFVAARQAKEAGQNA